MKNILAVEHEIHTREENLKRLAEKESAGNKLTEYEKSVKEKCEREIPELRDAARFISEHIIFC